MSLMDMSCSSIVYCIVATNRKKSYVGVTNNFEKRLAQHNGRKAGGARYTSGGKWASLFHVHGLKDRRHALQLEWLLHASRISIPKAPPNPFGDVCYSRRAWKLYWAFKKERFTKKAPLNKENTFTIHWFDSKFFTIAKSLDWDDTIVHVSG